MVTALEEFRARHRQSYNKYINSFAWLRQKEAALKRAGNKCQRCEKDGNKLFVHHLNYKRFTQERPEDLEVLCELCHILADQEREKAVRFENQSKLYDVQLDGWASKVYGEDWADCHDVEMISEEFREWLEEQ